MKALSAVLVLSITALLASCVSVEESTIVRPAGSQPYQGSRQALVSKGEALWNDASIGTSGVSCQSCHANGSFFKESFALSYSHTVAMASDVAGVDSVDAEQMVQLCMIVPMKSGPLPWQSEELAALTAYIEDVIQPAYIENR